jgi:plastocyanin
MRNRIGKRGTVLFAVVVLATAAVAGGALAAVAAHDTASTTTTKVTATETNYKIALSRVSVPAGKVIFTVHNASKTAHDFGIKGLNFTTKSIAGTIAPGATKSLTVTLKKGTYTVFCKLHIALGMKKTLKVGAGTGTTTTHTTTTSTWA